MSTVYTLNGKVLKNSANDKWLAKKEAPAPPDPPTPPIDPYNPLNLPSNTVRVRTNDNQPPRKGKSTSYETATLVAGTTNVYDVYKSGTNFTNFLSSSNNVKEILGANTTGIKDMSDMFNSCTSLTSVSLFDTSSVTKMANMFYNNNKLTSTPLFDTSNVTNMANMFYTCGSLTSIPLFNTSNVTNMYYMFYNCQSLTSIPLFNTYKVTNMSSMFEDCWSVESGALALYQQASSQTTPPTYHTDTFSSCGEDTGTGAAELAQIPSDWK